MSVVESQSAEDFKDTPDEQARRWSMELSAARKEVEAWHNSAKKILERFKDERQASENGDTRWNLFTSNIQTQRAMLYGRPPQVSVDRRFADANDDVARVAGEMLRRLMNSDIERDSDSYSLALQYALDDRLLVGMGSARVRYVADFETQEVEAVLGPEGNELAAGYSEEVKTREDVETDYLHWRDMLWSPARVWHEVRWLAFRAEMSRSQLIERFGEEVGKNVPLNAAKGARDAEDKKVANPWARAEVWEIWDKDSRKVVWYVEGYGQTLDSKDDPLGLESFFPCPRPMLANATTDKLLPRPDFAVAQDLYNEIDTVSTRITLLERAIRVAGVYNKASGEVRRLLSESTSNELIPVDNWGLFAEKGGISGQIDWLPLDQIVGALTSLRDYRRELMDALYQITGMSDIMRGQASGPATATEQSIKAKFGSVRIQSLQDEFARFASDVQKLKAEIVSKHFDAQTILERSNIEFTPDAQLAPQAVELLKSKLHCYRVEVKPENVSLTDFAALKAERMEVIQGISMFLSAMTPMVQAQPASMPFLLQMLQAGVAGMRGSSTMEGILDAAIAAAQQQAAQPQQQAPDSKLQAQMMKGQQDLQKIDKELQADLIRTQAEVQADGQREQNQMMWNVREAAAKHQITQAGKPMKPNGGMP
jgi:hypothetical protein